MSDTAGPSKRVCYGDPDCESTLLDWLNESDNDNSDNEDVEENCMEERDHSTETEIEQDSDEETVIEEDMDFENENLNSTEAVKNWYGKNRYKWSSLSFINRTRTQKHNILVQLPGLRASANLGHTADPISIWNMLFSNGLLKIILQWTNKKIQALRERYKNLKRSELEDLNMQELKAFIGLLFYTAIFSSNHEKIERIFATDGSGRDIFRCVISKNRFAFLLICLRFDNSETRLERRQTNSLAPISDIFEQFISNSQALYVPGANMCIDEMLISFRGRCKYKMYMPMKPCKYGIKLVCMTDARTHYFFNGYVYCGKNTDGTGLNENEKKLSKPTQAVLKLTKPIENTNRNITADNWFTSIELVEELRRRGLTYVGTIKKNKREIPKQFLPHRKRLVGSALFGFTKNISLLSYVPRKNRCALLVSSMHHTKGIDDTTQKPEIISYYNFTKGGVDALDEKCTKHTTSRRTQRWPMVIFFRLLDISGVNAHVLYQSFKNNKPLEKTDFLKQLADQLVRPQLEKRATNFHLKRELRLSINRILGIADERPQLQDEKLEKRKTCYLCPARIKRKTFHLCFVCAKPICLECSSKMCQDCKNNN